jgi:hypothetical protein
MTNRGRFCILPTFLFLYYGGLAQATINSNSKVIDGIEYYVQTDKSIYQFGEQVEMLYKITNLSEQSVTFTSSSSPIWDFWAEKDGEQLWHSCPVLRPSVTQLTLAPGESVLFPEWAPFYFVWNLKYNNGDTVGIGSYDIIGGLWSSVYDYTKVSVPIQIIPEPATLALFAMALPIFRVFTKIKK